MSDTNYADVIIVGTGNAGFAAAVSASENGAKVLMLEKAPEEYMGGNSALTIHMRFTYNSFSDLLPLVKDEKLTYNKLYTQKLQELQEAVTEYTESDYLKDRRGSYDIALKEINELQSKFGDFYKKDAIIWSW